MSIDASVAPAARDRRGPGGNEEENAHGPLEGLQGEVREIGRDRVAEARGEPGADAVVGAADDAVDPRRYAREGELAGLQPDELRVDAAAARPPRPDEPRMPAGGGGRDVAVGRRVRGQLRVEPLRLGQRVGECSAVAKEPEEEGPEEPRRRRRLPEGLDEDPVRARLRLEPPPHRPVGDERPRGAGEGCEDQEEDRRGGDHERRADGQKERDQEREVRGGAQGGEAPEDGAGDEGDEVHPEELLPAMRERTEHEVGRGDDDAAEDEDPDGHGLRVPPRVREHEREGDGRGDEEKAEPPVGVAVEEEAEDAAPPVALRRGLVEVLDGRGREEADGGDQDPARDVEERLDAPERIERLRGDEAAHRMIVAPPRPPLV
jgi:hypothetical protein